MKQELELFSFLCLLLVVSSLVHLYMYDRCKNEGLVLKNQITSADVTNDILYKQYADFI